MDRHQILQFLWQLLESDYAKRRLIKKNDYTTLVTRKRPDGLLFIISQPGKPAPIHLSIHVSDDSVVFHFEAGKTFERDLFKWSFTEFEEVVRRWLRFGIDYRLDLALLWRLFGPRKLYILPLENEDVELWKAEAGGSQPKETEIDADELIRIQQWFVEQIKIPEPKSNTRVLTIDGIELTTQLKKLRTSVLLRDPMMPEEYAILDREGKIEITVGPKASGLLIKRLQQYFPDYENTLRMLITLLEKARVTKIAIPLLLEALLILQHLPS